MVADMLLEFCGYFETISVIAQLFKFVLKICQSTITERTRFEWN